MAKPDSQAEIACDYQDAGVGAPDESDFDNNLVRIKDEGERIPGAKKWVGHLKPSAGSGKYKSSGNYSKVTTAQKNMWKGWQMSRDKKEAPRYCKARYYFKEKENDDKLKRERAWQLHDARFVLKWKVEEDTQ